MLVAVNGAGRRIIAARDLVRAGDYCCPLCEAQVTLKAGRSVIAHFAHVRRGDCIAEGEGRRHLAAKKLVHDRLSTRGLAVELEVMLARDRRADLLVRGPRGGRLTIEIQDSRIAVETMRAREQADRLAGCIATCWVFTDHRVPATVFCEVCPEVRLTDDLRYRWHSTHLPVPVLHRERLWGLTFERAYRDGDEWYEAGELRESDGRWLKSTFRVSGVLGLDFWPITVKDRYGRQQIGFAEAGDEFFEASCEDLDRAWGLVDG